MPDLDAVLTSSRSVIKQSPAKLVTRHESAGATYYIKRYIHSAVPLRPLKFFFKRSQAANEWILAQALAQRGVPIVEHLALGERWSSRGLLESILITKGFDGRQLDETPSVNGPSIVAFIEHLASKSVLHTDMHPANILVNVERGEFRLVDLHGIRLATGANPARLRDEMLAQLCITTPLPVSDAVKRLGLSKRKKLLETRSARCLKTNRDFTSHMSNGLRWHVRREDLPKAASALENPDAFVKRGRCLKRGNSTTVALADHLVLKRFNFTQWMRPLKDLARGSRARQAFRKGYHLEICGIPTARPVACADETCCGIVKRSFIVTAEIAGARELGAVSSDLLLIAHRVGTLIARLHEEGFTHSDLKETNLLLDSAQNPHLIDLDGLDFVDEVSHSAAAENLHRLAQSAAKCGQLTRGTITAFLKAYCRIRNLRPRQVVER